MKEHGDIVSVKIAGKSIVLINHPKYVRHVLKSAVEDYGKSSSYDELKLLLGNGLLTSEGDAWKTSRKAVNPAFYKTKLDGLIASMTSCIDHTIALWSSKAEKGEELLIDISKEMLDTTLQVVNTSLFGNQSLEKTRQINESLMQCMSFTYNRMESILNWPLWLPTIALKRFEHHRARLYGIVDDIVDKKEGSAAGDDLVSILMLANQAAPEEYTTNRLKEDALTLMLAGYETTAVTLSWLFYLLSCYSEVQEKVYRETGSVIESDGTISFQKLQELTFTQAVINETLRLYPPVWSFSREALVDDMLVDVPVEKGQMVVLSPYCLHRHPDFWEAPEEFRPERFLDTDISPDVFFPFGGGRRKCIGNHFAYTEILLFLIHVCRRFTLEFVPDQDLTFKSGLTLRTKEALHIILKPRFKT